MKNEGATGKHVRTGMKEVVRKVFDTVGGTEEKSLSGRSNIMLL